jgi:hypothetical protein
MAGENMAGGPGDDVVAAALLEVEDLSVEVEDFGPPGRGCMRCSTEVRS